MLVLPDVLTGITNTRELQGQLPLESLIQTRQSQEQACADSASVALEVKSGRCPSVPVKQPDSFNLVYRERQTRPLKGDPSTWSVHPPRAPGKHKKKKKKRKSGLKLIPAAGESAVRGAEGGDSGLHV
ncbi:hypothetical protein NDU88_006130 [Pleurodeles waltl]|uniref:Uncharacterized protein n=1 Tax=Pleurodeles waltl TaxID=8319 RepID=A0AAV7NYH7_PLEWA|nr:hypothetical protein NDU88_006130 [Pleurodeles waltl]